MRRSFDYGVTCVIMGGGQGSRLFPLTKDRSKPAVPLGTKYRLIDIPISNCINSGLNRIYVLTQFNSTSLHRHIHQSYHFDRFSRGFVEILAAQQTPEYGATSWYEGTADAVRKNLPRLKESNGQEILILSGDQIYRMNYSDVLATHRGGQGAEGSPVTVAVLLVQRERARQLGILEIDETGHVSRFVEKPGNNDALLDTLAAPPALVAKTGLSPSDGPWFLANMGIYVFELPILARALDTPATDFGREILPEIIKQHSVRAHLFSGYWEDIGTIPSFLQANLDLATERPHFDFYSGDEPIYTRARLLPAAKIRRLEATDSLIAEASRIESAVIERSLIGIRSIIGRDVTIRDSYLMGNDYFKGDGPSGERPSGERQLPGIGDGSVIENAIVDKNARIGRNVRIRNSAGRQEYEDGHVYIRDGVVVVPRNGELPDGYEV